MGGLYNFGRSAKNSGIASRAAIIGCPISSIRWVVTTPWGHATCHSEKGDRSVLAALSGSTRPLLIEWRPGAHSQTFCQRPLCAEA
jgi:hypothetical protein